MNKKHNPAARNQLAKRIAPGFWIDKEGNRHISITEILQAVGLPDTGENRALCRMVAHTEMQKLNPGSQTIDRQGHCPNCNGQVLKLTGDALGTFECLECGATFLESMLKP